MDPTNSKHTMRMAIGFSVLMSGAVLLTAGGMFRSQGTSQQTEIAAPSASDFNAVVAGIYGRLNRLPTLEKQMLANAGTPERASAYGRKREDARRQIDELMRKARSEAVGAADSKRLDQLAALTVQADARFERMRTLIARRQAGTRIAEKSD